MLLQRRLQTVIILSIQKEAGLLFLKIINNINFKCLSQLEKTYYKKKKYLPSFRVRKLKLWFEELDLLVLDHMIENLPVRQMRIWLPSVLKQLPQCDPEGPVHNQRQSCWQVSQSAT